MKCLNVRNLKVLCTLRSKPIRMSKVLEDLGKRKVNESTRKSMENQ